MGAGEYPWSGAVACLIRLPIKLRTLVGLSGNQHSISDEKQQSLLFFRLVITTGAGLRASLALSSVKTLNQIDLLLRGGGEFAAEVCAAQRFI